MIGAGAQAAGSSPAGVGEPELGDAAPTAGGGSRYINPATGDYGIDSSTGAFEQMPAIRQRVMISLLTVRGSSTVLPDLGLIRPTKMGDRFQSEMEQAVRQALEQLTDIEQVISLDFVTVLRGNGGRGQITVSYTDLTTGAEDAVSV
jgi:hypothetical protein